MRVTLRGMIDFDGALVTVRVINLIERRALCVKALLDTGSPVTCIDFAQIVHPLNIPLFDLGGGGLHHIHQIQAIDANSQRYKIGIEILDGKGNKHVWDEVTAYRRDLPPAPFAMILGRDILERCTLSYDGRNKTFELVICDPEELSA